MDIQALKGTTLDDATFDKLVAHVSGLSTRTESAEAKVRTLQKEAAEATKQLKTERDAAFEKLGISAAEELDGVPDGKGAAEAAKQYEARLKKTEREKAELASTTQDLQAKLQNHRREQVLHKALSSQDFMEQDTPRAVLERGLKAEGDDFVYENPEGKRMSVSDAVAWLAKTKPHLVKAPGSGKTGSGTTAGQLGAGPIGKNPFAKATFNLTEQVRLAQENPQAAAAMKAAAST